ncbi:MAG: hypothetical protein JKY54_09780 [Flavobacteriales bacterium]|nr:hypothetical protein [Flavobacteriales bacterium]
MMLTITFLREPPPTTSEAVKAQRVKLSRSPILTVEDFLSTCRPTKARLHPTLRQSWANVVATTLRKVLKEQSPEARDQAMWDFLSLPHDYLPSEKRNVMEDNLLNGAPTPYRAARPKKDIDPEEAQVRKATALANQGCTMRKVAATLNQGKLADIDDPAVRSIVQSKFPTPKAPLQNSLPALCLEAVDELVITKCVRNQPTDSSGGLTGWTKELIHCAIEKHRDIPQLLSKVIACVLNKQFGAEMLKFFVTASLVNLEKWKKSGELDVRPLQIGCGFVKLIGAVCLAVSMPPVDEWQKGIGSKNGTAIIHRASVKALIDGKSILTVDASNAYNCMSRAHVEERLLQLNKPMLTQHFRLMYDSPTRLVARSRSGLPDTFWATEGFRQGDAPSGYYYCHGQSTAVEAAVPNMEKLAYLDDLTLYDADIDALLDGLEALAREYAHIGIAINYGKSELIYAGIITDLQRSRAKSLDLTVVEPADCVRLLGAPLGCAESNDKAQQWVFDKLDGLRKFCDRTAHPMFNSRLAYTLLRMCGSPKFTFLCQMVDPNIMTLGDRSVYSEADDIVAKAFEQITGIPAEHAYLYHDVLNDLKPFVVEGPLLYERMTDSVDNKTTKDEVAPITNPLAAYPELSVVMKSHLLSASGNHASAWLWYDPRHPMSSDDFNIALRLRHGYMPDRYQHCTCSFSFRDCEPIAALSHLLTCNTNIYSYTSRHDEIASDINQVLKDYNFATRREPRDFHGDDDRMRPDVTIFTSLVNRVIDVSVITNTSASHAGRKDAAGHAAALKEAKHQENVKKFPGHEFYPVIIESSGHVHASYDKLVKYLSKHVPYDDVRRFTVEMHRALTTATQRGNARILKGAMHRINTSREFGRTTIH